MLKKFASDSLGLSDIGQFISEDAFKDTDVFQYCLPSETPFIILRARSDEYCFTNKALIHLDGTSAMSKKRLLKRYPYKNHQLYEVLLETAGTIDLDAEISFRLGERSKNLHFSLDVHKNQLPALVLLYQILMTISEEQAHHHRQATIIDDAVTASVRLFEKMERVQLATSVGPSLQKQDALATTLKGSCEYLESRKKDVDHYIHHDDYTHVFRAILTNEEGEQ